MSNNKVYNQALSLLNNANTVNNNTTVKAMLTNTKVSIAVNLNVNSLGQAQERNENSKVLLNTHNGSIKWNGRTSQTFIDFQPCPSAEKANFTPVFEVDAEGNRKELDRVEFWASVCGTDEEGFVNTARITANLDMSVRELTDLIKSGAKAIEFTFDVAEAGSAFIFKGISESKSKKLQTVTKEVMLTFGPAVTSDVSDAVILSDSTFIHSNVIKEAIANGRKVAPGAGVANMSAATQGVTVSSRRRAARRAAHEAAVQAPAPVSSIAAMMNQAPAQPAPAAAQSSTDAKLDAIMAMVGNLQTQVAELKAENAALRAENEALKAGKVAPQSEAARASLDSAVEEAAPEVEEVADKAPQSIEDCFEMFGEEMDEDEMNALPEEAFVDSFDSFDADEEDEDVDIFAPASSTASEALV